MFRSWRALDGTSKKRYYALHSCGRYVPSGDGCPDHTGDNHPGVNEARNPGMFELAFVLETTSFIAYIEFHESVHYSEAEEKQLADLLLREEVVILTFSDFVGNTYPWSNIYDLFGSLHLQ